MTLLVVGASPRTTLEIRTEAARVSMAVRTRARRAPDWAIVATVVQRTEVIKRYGLPPYRVIQLPELASDDGLTSDVIRAGLAKMTGIGKWRPVTSVIGVSLVRRLLPPLVRWVVHQITREEQRQLDSNEPPRTLKEARRAARLAAGFAGWVRRSERR